MSWKRISIEAVVSCSAFIGGRAAKSAKDPSSIFVLRNNDIGDLLIVTPLFEALKRMFAQTKIIAGIGSWNKPVLLNNPWVDEVLSINAPWHNKQVCQSPHNSLRGLLNSLRYIFTSDEARFLKRRKCGIGIDVLGSPEGALLMMRAGVPWRLGVKGYAGGHSACQQNVIFDEQTQVGRAALKFAELLGATRLPESRPQLFLVESEKAQARKTWNALERHGKTRSTCILIAPGGGLTEKSWPQENYRELARKLAFRPNVKILVVGGESDYDVKGRGKTSHFGSPQNQPPQAGLVCGS